MGEAYLVGGVRTPVGRYGGALAGVRPDDLAALVVARGGAPRRRRPTTPIDEVVLGAANQAGEDNRNVARMAVAARRPARHRARLHGQPAVRQRPAGRRCRAAQAIRAARPTSSSPVASSR